MAASTRLTEEPIAAEAELAAFTAAAPGPGRW